MITKKEVQHIASLARIGATEDELESFSQDLSNILEWIDQLKEVDIDGVEPTAHIIGRKNIVREDKDYEFPNKKEIINLFPESKDEYNKVRSVL